MELHNQGVTFPKGFKAAAVHSGLRTQSSEADVILLVCDTPAPWAATFTTNKVKAAPVVVTTDHIEKQINGRAAVCNVAYANAATGDRGMNDSLTTARQVAKLLDIPAEQVAVASTGIIGEPIPMDKLSSGIEQCAADLKSGDEIDQAAARGILTTDTGPKTSSVEIIIDGKPVRIAGMAKGAGMIAPNMATMLCFITTDAVIKRNVLSQLLAESVKKSFNCVTVDGHTSTNDMVLVMASGQAENSPIARGRRGYFEFAEALDAVCLDLALKIVADGEGATRTMEIVVDGAVSVEDARLAAFAIANSPLVKCALHGKDPNWGRIVSAVGYCGCRMKPEFTQVKIGDVIIYDKGQPVEGSKLEAAKQMDCDRVLINVELGLGRGKFTVWGCDLSNEYVHINADYHT